MARAGISPRSKCWPNKVVYVSMQNRKLDEPVVYILDDHDPRYKDFQEFIKHIRPSKLFGARLFEHFQKLDDTRFLLGVGRAKFLQFGGFSSRRRRILRRKTMSFLNHAWFCFGLV